MIRSKIYVGEMWENCEDGDAKIFKASLYSK